MRVGSIGRVEGDRTEPFRHIQLSTVYNASLIRGNDFSVGDVTCKSPGHGLRVIFLVLAFATGPGAQFAAGAVFLLAKSKKAGGLLSWQY